MDKKDDFLLKVEDLKTYFPQRKGVFRRIVGYVKAVDGVNFSLNSKETLGVVGESGCGKSTLANTIMRGEDPTEGKILYNNEGNIVDIAKLDSRQLRKIRQDIQMIFQDPFSSLDPRMTVRDVIGEPLLINKRAQGDELDDIVIQLMKDVGLDTKYLRRYPHAFSGGQRQRIGVARALSLNPKIVLADEPTSALDVSVQSQILNLLYTLQEKYSLSYMFISHDLNVVEHISEKMGVMYVGTFVEIADTDKIFKQPHHPYTEALLSAVPLPDPHHQRERILLEGDVPDPASLPSGCPFHTRCKYAKDICKEKRPELKAIQDDSSHLAACHFAGELQLKSVGA